MLQQQKDLVSGKDIRAMVRTHAASKPYLSNWGGINTGGSKYLLDKSIINPGMYNYHVGSWQNYNHKMIYMVRDIHKVLRSQFLVVLAGEESYQYGIPKNEAHWDTSILVDMTSDAEELVMEIMDYNKQKYTHLDNINALPTDVFDPKKNMHFCTFEGFRDDLSLNVAKLEVFLNTEINASEYPRMNGTLFEWYANQTETYEENSRLFDKWESFIFEYCIDYTKWEKLSDYFESDLLTLYGIKRVY